jgi:hypothetical protein
MRFIVALLWIVGSSEIILADTTWVAPGEVQGTWTSAGSPYIIQGDIEVPATSGLFIDDGVRVYFNGHFAIIVYGWIVARGSADQPIVFTRDISDTTEYYNGWDGIHLEQAADTCRFEYCILNHVTGGGQLGAIRAQTSALQVLHCTISECYNSAGISTYGSCYALIDRCEIYRCHAGTGTFGGGIRIGGESFARIRDCYIHHCTAQNGGGFCIEGSTGANWTASGIVEGCLISHNSCLLWGGGVHSSGPKNEYRNCVFWNNTATSGWVGGLDDHSDTLVVKNCTFVGNHGPWASQLRYWNSHGHNITSCIFKDGTGASSPVIGSTRYCCFHNTGDPSGAQHAVHADPLLVDVDSGDFHLTENSPCIDAGDPDLPLDPDGTRADIGAFYFYQDTTNQDTSEAATPLPVPESVLLFEAYPNPFNSAINLSVNVPASQKVKLTIFDLMGRQIETVLDDRLTAGKHSMRWTPNSLPTGIYFARLTAGEHHLERKIIYLK